MEKNVDKNEEFQIKGLFVCSGVRLVQKKQTYIGDKKADGTQDYYYNLSFTNGEDLFSCTCGKFGDTLCLNRQYNLGFDYIDKKLKLVSFQQLT